MPTVDPRDAELAALERDLAELFELAKSGAYDSDEPREHWVARKLRLIAEDALRTRPEPLAGSGVADLDKHVAYWIEDIAPAYAGGGPQGRELREGAMARLWDRIRSSPMFLSALRAHPAPDQSAQCSGEVVEVVAKAIYDAPDEQSGDTVGTVIWNSEHLFYETIDGEEIVDKARRASMPVCRSAARAAIAALSAPRPDEGVVEALRRATIRSYSHKQLDLSLEFQNSDDLTAVVTSVGATPEKRP
jgi:hypothetical protein